MNFKVCRNSSLHLRGNLYVHYKSLDSALLAYQSVNGRYFAGKQITCEFVGVTKWRVAICGEFMRSRLKTCSRGTACNFIHCFRNPGGDYEWADWDKPPPKYWVREMAALFGLSPVSIYDTERNTEGRRSREITDRDYRRLWSRERKSSRDYRQDEYDSQSRHHKRHQSHHRKLSVYLKSKNEVCDSDSERDLSNEERDEDSHHFKTRISNRQLDNQDYHKSNAHRSNSDAYWSDIDRDRDRDTERNRKVGGHTDKKKDDVHRKHKGKSSTPKRKSKEKSDISDEDTHYTMKWKSWDKTDSADEDEHHKIKGKSSNYKRESRDRWDSNDDDSELIIEDKGKRHKRCRKSSEHSNEDINRRGRWDDKVGVEN